MRIVDLTQPWGDRMPWRWLGGEGCVCRVTAFLDMDVPGVEGASPPGAQSRRDDATRPPARVTADARGGVSY